MTKVAFTQFSANGIALVIASLGLDGDRVCIACSHLGVTKKPKNASCAWS